MREVPIGASIEAVWEALRDPRGSMSWTDSLHRLKFLSEVGPGWLERRRRANIVYPSSVESVDPVTESLE